MPICEYRSCNRPVVYLPRATPKGRVRFVAFDPPEKRWAEIEGKAVLVDAYQPHSESCLEPSGKKAEG